MGERYYDPNIGRWMQQDPIDQTGDQRQENRYSYVGGDPINNIDPTGTDIFDDIGDVSNDITKAYDEYVAQPLRTRGGRVVGRCVIGGGLGGVGARLVSLPVGAGATLGCISYNALYRFR